MNTRPTFGPRLLDTPPLCSERGLWDYRKLEIRALCDLQRYTRMQCCGGDAHWVSQMANSIKQPQTTLRGYELVSAFGLTKPHGAN